MMGVYIILGIAGFTLVYCGFTGTDPRDEIAKAFPAAKPRGKKTSGAGGATPADTTEGTTVLDPFDPSLDPLLNAAAQTDGGAGRFS